MARIKYKQLDQLSYEDIVVYNSLPPDPFWTKVSETVDFSFADELCAPLYSTQGQHPYAPSLKLKVHLLQRYYGYADREIEHATIFDISVKRFLGLPIAHKGLDHSTISLDRERLGGDLFEACHQHILAQALDRKLWGQTESRWLIDSFHTHANVAKAGAHRLIQQAVIRIVNYLKGTFPKLHNRLLLEVELQAANKRLSHKTPEDKQVLSFSRLVVEAYSLLYWMESESVAPLFWAWENKKRQLKCLELQAILIQILRENTRPTTSSLPEPTGRPAEKSQKEHEQLEIQYVKIPRKERPANRIESAFDPEVRTGHKSVNLPFRGEKVQLLEEANSGLLLAAKVIPGNELDGWAMAAMVKSVRERFGISPTEVVADSAYGYGPQRQEMAEAKVALSAPVTNRARENGLFSADQFTIDPQKKNAICPAGHSTVRRTRNNKENGVQIFFDEKICHSCPSRRDCTTSKSGRSLFISDYYELLQQAKAYNATEAGKAAQGERYKIERSNNELKNHHKLSRARTRGRARFRIDVLVGVMVVNLKRIVKTCGGWNSSALRRYPPRQAPVCPKPALG